MFDAWSAYSDEAKPYLLGQQYGSADCSIDLTTLQTNTNAQQQGNREAAISYAAYRLIRHRFAASPSAAVTALNADNLMAELGYDIAEQSSDTAQGDASALGNFIAECYIQFGLQDGSNEANGYSSVHYAPVNPPLSPQLPGNPDITDPNRWQPLTLDVFIDQSGNVIPFNTPEFLGPEWGQVTPFALSSDDANIYERDYD
mgnify:CR=1 FL=1